VHIFVFIGHSRYNSCSFSLYKAGCTGGFSRLPLRTRLQRCVHSATAQIHVIYIFIEFFEGTKCSVPAFPCFAPKPCGYNFPILHDDGPNVKVKLSTIFVDTLFCQLHCQFAKLSFLRDKDMVCAFIR
jgi:hypothetical protein